MHNREHLCDLQGTCLESFANLDISEQLGNVNTGTPNAYDSKESLNIIINYHMSLFLAAVLSNLLGLYPDIPYCR